MGDFKLSQFKKIYVYIASTVKFLGDVSWRYMAFNFHLFSPNVCNRDFLPFNHDLCYPDPRISYCSYLKVAMSVLDVQQAVIMPAKAILSTGDVKMKEYSTYPQRVCCLPIIMHGSHQLFFSFFFCCLSFYLFFRNKGRVGERKGKKHRCARETSISCLLLTPNQGPNLQPRHLPQPRINWWPLGLQDNAQPTEPHQSGQLPSALNAQIF